MSTKRGRPKRNQAKHVSPPRLDKDGVKRKIIEAFKGKIDITCPKNVTKYSKDTCKATENALANEQKVQSQPRKKHCPEQISWKPPPPRMINDSNYVKKIITTETLKDTIFKPTPVASGVDSRDDKKIEIDSNGDQRKVSNGEISPSRYSTKLKNKSKNVLLNTIQPIQEINTHPKELLGIDTCSKMRGNPTEYVKNNDTQMDYQNVSAAEECSNIHGRKHDNSIEIIHKLDQQLSSDILVVGVATGGPLLTDIRRESTSSKVLNHSQSSMQHSSSDLSPHDQALGINEEIKMKKKLMLTPNKNPQHNLQVIIEENMKNEDEASSHALGSCDTLQDELLAMFQDSEPINIVNNTQLEAEPDVNSEQSCSPIVDLCSSSNPSQQDSISDHKIHKNVPNDEENQTEYVDLDKDTDIFVNPITGLTEIIAPGADRTPSMKPSNTPLEAEPVVEQMFSPTADNSSYNKTKTNITNVEQIQHEYLVDMDTEEFKNSVSGFTQILAAAEAEHLQSIKPKKTVQSEQSMEMDDNLDIFSSLEYRDNTNQGNARGTNQDLEIPSVEQIQRREQAIRKIRTVCQDIMKSNDMLLLVRKQVWPQCSSTKETSHAPSYSGKRNIWNKDTTSGIPTSRIPSSDWSWKMQETKQKIKTTSQELCRLNALMLRMKRESLQQQPSTSKGALGSLANRTVPNCPERGNFSRRTLSNQI